MSEIKKHSFFSSINFDDIKKKKTKAHFKPTIDKEDITNNFDEEYLTMEVSESPVADWSKEDEYSNWFIKFENTGDDEEFEDISKEADNNQAPDGGDDDDN